MEELGIFAFLFQFIDQWAYLITFLVMVFENVIFIGMFTPGDVVVLLASFTATLGNAKIWGVALASALGTLIGNNLTYSLCYKYGRGLLLSIGDWASKRRFLSKIIKIDEASLQNAEDYFEKHGSKTVFVARFVAGLKAYIIAISGASRMRLRTFELYTILSAIVYSALMCTIGWFLGDNISVALDVVSYIGYGGLAIFIVAIVALIFAKKRSNKKKEAKASLEEASVGEGPLDNSAEESVSSEDKDA